MISKWDKFESRTRNESKLMFPNCEGCMYLDKTLWACLYCLKKGNPCRTTGTYQTKVDIWPGGGCDLKNTNKPKKRHSGLVLSKRQKKDLKKPPFGGLNQERAKKLYESGANDAQIALALHSSKYHVSMWRRANNMKSNYWKGEAP